MLQALLAAACLLIPQADDTASELRSPLSPAPQSGVASSETHDWPHWRGPDRNGISPETGWVSEGAEESLWEAQVGIGYSSPSISRGRLYTRGFFLNGEADKQGDDITFCLNAETGEELWTHAEPAKLWDNMHGGGTLSTPTVDGEVVFVLARMGTLRAHAVDDGSVLWERELNQELGVELGPFGFCSSPLVLGDVLYVNVGVSLALHKKTGKTIWKTRDYGSSYGTPEPFVLEGRAMLAVFNAVGLTILDRKDGAEVAVHPWTSQYNVNAASPIVIGNRIFISTGYNELGGVLLELEGDKLEPVWSTKRMNNLMNGCVRVGDLLFGFDKTILRCLDLEGKEQWSERGLGRGTVIASDGRLIVLSEEGELIIAQATREEFAPLSRAAVLSEGKCWTTPVLTGGRIYCRNSTGTLVCRDHRATE